MATLRTTRNFNHPYDKVKVIKALRAISGIGLKDAKDGVEMAADGTSFEFICNTAMNCHVEELDTMHNNGFTISELDTKIGIVLESVKQSAIFATKEGDNELSKLLLNVLTDFEQVQQRREEDRAELVEARKIREQAEKLRHAEREVLQHEREMRHAEQQAHEDERRRNKREQELRITRQLDAQE